MSETETVPGGGETPEPVPETEPPAPGTEGEDPEPTPEQAEAEAAEQESRRERRMARLNQRYAEADRERIRLAEENEYLRRTLHPPPEPQALPQTPEELERLVDARAEAKAAQQAVQARIDVFHKEARAACDDWDTRRQALIQMGADTEFSHLLVEMPDGARLAVALYDDPDELERITALKTSTARAIALGKYAATLEGKPAPLARRTAPLPAPITPIGGRTRTAFNEYTATDASDLAERYSRQNLERHRRGY